VHRAVFRIKGSMRWRRCGRSSVRSVPNGGDWSTVDVGPAAADKPYEQHTIPG